MNEPGDSLPASPLFHNQASLGISNPPKPWDNAYDQASKLPDKFPQILDPNSTPHEQQPSVALVGGSAQAPLHGAGRRRTATDQPQAGKGASAGRKPLQNTKPGLLVLLTRD